MDDDFAQDLIAAIDDCPVHAKNDYWNWTPQTRQEYQAYYTAKKARARQPAIFEEDAGEGEEDAQEVDEEDAHEADAEQEQAATEAPAKKGPTRWVEYQQIARGELQEETGQKKVPLKDVNARARAYYKADGWGAE